MDTGIKLDFTARGGGAEQLDSASLFDASPLQLMLKQIIVQVALHDELLRNMPKPEAYSVTGESRKQDEQAVVTPQDVAADRDTNEKVPDTVEEGSSVTFEDHLAGDDDNDNDNNIEGDTATMSDVLKRLTLVEQISDKANNAINALQKKVAELEKRDKVPEGSNFTVSDDGSQDQTGDNDDQSEESEPVEKDLKSVLLQGSNDAIDSKPSNNVTGVVGPFTEEKSEKAKGYDALNQRIGALEAQMTKILGGQPKLIRDASDPSDPSDRAESTESNEIEKIQEMERDEQEDEISSELLPILDRITSLEKIIENTRSALQATNSKVDRLDDRVTDIENQFGRSEQDVIVKNDETTPLLLRSTVSDPEEAEDSVGHVTEEEILLDSHSLATSPSQSISHSGTKIAETSERSINISDFEDRLKKYEKELADLRKVVLASQRTSDSVSPRFSPRDNITGSENNDHSQKISFSTTIQHSNPVIEDDGKPASDAIIPPVDLTATTSNVENEFILYVDNMFDNIAMRVMALESTIHDIQHMLNSLAASNNDARMSADIINDSTGHHHHDNDSSCDGHSTMSPITPPTPPDDARDQNAREGRAPRFVPSSTTKQSEQGIGYNEQEANTMMNRRDGMDDDIWDKLEEKADKRNVHELEDKIKNMLNTITNLQQDMQRIDLDDIATIEQIRDLENMLIKKADRQDLRDFVGLQMNAGADGFDFGGTITQIDGGDGLKQQETQQTLDGISPRTDDSNDIKQIKNALNSHAKHIQMLHKTKADNSQVFKDLDAKSEQLDKIEQFKADASIVARKADRDYVDNALDRIRKEMEKLLDRSQVDGTDEMARDIEYLKNLLHGKASRQDLSEMRNIIDDVKKSTSGTTAEGLVGHKGFRCLSCNREMPGMRERPSKMNFESFLNRLPNPKGRLYSRNTMLNPYGYPSSLPPGMNTSTGRSNMAGHPQRHGSHFRSHLPARPLREKEESNTLIVHENIAEEDEEDKTTVSLADPEIQVMTEEHQEIAYDDDDDGGQELSGYRRQTPTLPKIK